MAFFSPLGVLEDQLLVKVVKDKLMSNPCKNQGFVLDGFPKTYEQARELFSGETLKHGSHCTGVIIPLTLQSQHILYFSIYTDEQDSDEASSMNPSNSKRIMPGVCFLLSQQWRLDRFLDLVANRT